MILEAGVSPAGPWLDDSVVHAVTGGLLD